MKPEVLLEVLESAADQLSVKVSYESLLTTGIGINAGGLRGGLCRVKGSDGMAWRVIIDKRATTEERVSTLATALAKFDTSQLELPAKVREVLRMHEPSSKHRMTAA